MFQFNIWSTKDQNTANERERNEKKREKSARRKIKNGKRKERNGAEEVKDITPVLMQAGNTREGKVSTFPQIRDFLKKAYKPTKAEFQTWDASNIVQKRNDYNK